LICVGGFCLQMRAVVVAGSTISFEPFFLTRTYAFWSLYCSAMRGEMFDLKPPVPIPMITSPTEKIAMEAPGLVMTWGIAEKMRRM
jgi:hypothetical protein